MNFRALLLIVPSFLPAVAGAGLVLRSPGDYEVVQQGADGWAAVRMAGRVDAGDGPREVEWRLVEEGTGTEGWTRTPVDVSGQEFSAELRIPAGGWYRLEVRSAAGEAAVPHVGVGEVFVVAGQSNSANHGEERQETKTGRVAAFDGSGWRLSRDPQPGASGDGGSFLPVFGDAVVAEFGVPVGLVACGIGATSVREWLPAGSVFPNPPTIESRVVKRADGQWESRGEAWEMLRARLQRLGPDGFRAVLWHQGESDANQADVSRTLPGSLYREYLGKLIGESRRAVGWEVPWFVAQVSYHVPGDEGSEDIRAAQAALWKDGLALEGPDSDALRGEFRDGGGKGVHFSGAGLREHGARWAAKVSPWLRRQPGVLPAGLVLDLDAGKGVTRDDAGRVVAWRSVVPGGTVRAFVARDEGRAEAGSGRPFLVRDADGVPAVEFRQQELVCLDEDAFDELTQGSGCTWVALLRPYAQREGLKDVNSFFGNLRNGGFFEGVWGCLTDDNRIWWGPRNGQSFGRFDGNNPQLLGPQLPGDRFSVVAGRMGAGTGKVTCELFVGGPESVVSAEVGIHAGANASKLAIGQERDAVEHPGQESFDGELAGLVMFARALDDGELASVMTRMRLRREKPRKILFLGNSITLHGPAPEIGWEGNHGMAASAPEKDYVHLVVRGLAEKGRAAPVAVVKNIAGFERGYRSWDAAKELDGEIAEGARDVVVAVGENVPALAHADDEAAFAEAFRRLLAEVSRDGARVYVRSCFWPDAVKDGIMQRVAREAEAVFVDVAGIGRNPAHAARSERTIGHDGVAGHPGDRGMRALADAILAAMRGKP
jgi:hypothetical protein